MSSLRQLLEEGYFHADPHPGNVVVTKEGVLAYFDFGMMSEFRREYRIGLIRTVSNSTCSYYSYLSIQPNFGLELVVLHTTLCLVNFQCMFEVGVEV